MNKELIKEIDFSVRSELKNEEACRELVSKAVMKALNGFEFSAGYQVSISFVEEAEIQSLNKLYRNVDSVTDVLSFPMEETDQRGVDILGDIVICVARAEAQALEFGHSAEREIAYLSVHSALHLMGYDHMEEEDKLEMRAEEKRIMKELAIFKNESECEQ